MSQFTLTPEEDALVVDALRAKAAQYSAMFGAADPALEALVAKVSFVEAPVDEDDAPVVVEETPVVEEVTEAAPEAE
jgi:hypothetical protein